MNSWIAKGRPALLLAPMEGVTDAPMRALMSERGGFTHLVTEFLRVSQTVLPAKVFHRDVSELRAAGGNRGRTKEGLPVIVQLLGGNPERLAASAQEAVKLGALGIDLNFGCPAPTVNSHDGGATLLKFPCRLEEIVRAVRMAVPPHLSVSVKMRLGWDSAEPLLENCARSERAGASWITIHARTKTQGYQPPVYWGEIGEARKRARVPVVANGDIRSLSDLRSCREQTGCEHFMIGRGALANPSLPLLAARELGLQARIVSPEPSPEEWREMILRFLEISAPLSDHPAYGLRRVKQWLRFAATLGNFREFDLVKRLEEESELRAMIPALRFRELAAPAQPAMAP
jgi:tRNA-dihydrouridine synthase C